MSPKYSLNWNDAKSIFVTVGIVAASAAVSQLITMVPNINFGANSAVVTIVLVGVLKVVQKYLAGK